MKLPSNNISTETSGMLLTKSFGVGDIGIIFDILRNKLYRDPIVAICREYTCNARDAHREAGIPDRPIEISLPNTFSPYFKVKDFGIGISPDRMENIFIKYASSSKRADNLQTGAFGIGAKSGFSYSDTFSIVTVTERIKRTYHAYIDETQIGKIALASETSTDEPTGTTIIIPVLKDDFYAFVRATLECTEYWKPRPMLLGCTPAPEYQNETVILSGNGWDLVKSSSYNRNIVAVIDGIGYQIDSYAIKAIKGAERSWLSNSFSIYFGNGELSLVASRDSIHYDERTQKVILDRIEKINKNFIELVTQKVENCSDYRSACGVLADISSRVSSSHIIAELRKITWRDQKILPEIRSNHLGQYARINSYVADSSAKSSSSYVKDARNTNINLSNSTLYWNDKDSQLVHYSVINYLFTLHPGVKKLQIISTPSKPKNKKYQRMSAQDVDFSPTYDLNLIELLNPIKLSTIKVPKIQKAKKVILPKSSTNTIPGYIFYQKYKRYISSIGLQSKKLSQDGRVYVEVECRKISNYRFGYFAELEAVSKFLGREIVGVARTHTKKLDPSWIPLKSALEEKLGNGNTSLDCLKQSYYSSSWVVGKKFSFINNSNIQEILNALTHKNELFGSYLQESLKIEKEMVLHQEEIQVIQILEKNQSTSDPNQDQTPLIQLYTDVTQQYPLLTQLRYHYDEEFSVKDIVDYIDLIDEHQRQSKSRNGNKNGKLKNNK